MPVSAPAALLPGAPVQAPAGFREQPAGPAVAPVAMWARWPVSDRIVARLSFENLAPYPHACLSESRPGSLSQPSLHFSPGRYGKLCEGGHPDKESSRYETS